MQKNTSTRLRIILSIVLLISAVKCNAQFYTILPKAPVEVKQESKEEKIDSLVDTLVVSKKIDVNLYASLPLSSPLYITSPYGYRNDPLTGKKKFHRGVDLRCNNEKVVAIFDGKVKKVGYEKKGLGHYIVLSHPPFEITYAHLEYALVEKGDKITAGEVVAVSGSSGRSTGPHLHLELKYRGKRCNPLPLLAFLDKNNRIYNKVKPTIMQGKQEMLTALAHVQEAYAEEYTAFLKEEGLIASEESAICFLELIEQDVFTS